MADADQVVVELIGRVEGFDAKIKQSANSFDGSMSRIERAARRGELAVAKSYAGLGQAQKLLTKQINDVGGLLETRSPFLTIAKQGAPAASAIRIVTTAGSLLGNVMGAAVVTGVLAAAGALATMLLKTNGTSKAIEEMIAKLKEKAEQEEVARQAAERFAHTEEGVEKAIRDATRAREDAIEATKSEAQRTFEAANNNLREEITIRNKTKAQLEYAETLLATARVQSAAPGQRGELGTLGLEVAQRSVDALHVQLEANDRHIAAAEAELRAATADFVDEGVKRGLDPVEKIKNLYEGPQGLIAKEKARLTAAKATTEEMAKQLAILEKAEKAAIDTAKQKPKLDADNTVFQRPVTGGGITGNFGESRPGHTHAGVDIAVPVGTGVRAAAAGTVIESGTIPGYGNVIVIDHGRGTISRYAHLSQLGAARGDVVNAGQQIGLSGGARGAVGAGNSQGPHLHYEVRVNGRAVNPLKGPFPTDALGANDKAQRLAAQAEREAAQEAERKRRQDNLLAGLNERYAEALAALAKGTEDSAEAKKAAIDLERDNFDKNIDARKDLDAAAKIEAKRLNDATAVLAKQLIDRAEAERRFRIEQEARQRDLATAEGAIQNAEEMLRSQEGLARTQAERRDIELKLLDLAFQEEKLRAQAVIAARDALQAELAKKGVDQLTDADRRALADANAQASVAQGALDTMPQRQANAEAGVNRDTAGPLQALLDSLPQSAAEISEAFETIAAHGLESLSDGITDAITGAKSLGEAFSGVAKSVVRDLVAMIVKMLIFRALASAFPGLFGGGGGVPLGSLMGGGDSGLGGTALFGGNAIPGAASGFLGTIGGSGGIDRNILSINGRPALRVSAGEGLAIIPNMSALNSSAARAGGGVTVVQHFTLDARHGITTPELLRHVNQVATTQAARAGKGAYDAAQAAVPARIDRQNRLGT